MALCEARQAKVETPRACQQFEDMLEGQLPDHSIEIIRPKEIQACSATLYGTPGWTSYSMYKANSKFLCDSSRTDYQREELLQILRDTTDVIPEIIHALNDHRSEAQTAMTQLRVTAASVDTAQREILLRAQEQGRVHSAQLDQLMQHMEALQESMAEAFSENTKVETFCDKTAKADTFQVLDLSTEKASHVDQKVTQAYASFVEIASGLTFDFEQQIRVLSDHVTSMIGQLSDISAHETLGSIEETLNTASQKASELIQLQDAQLATGQKVLRSLEDVSPQQLLPMWLSQLSLSAARWIEMLRFESTFFAIFAAPALGFSLYGSHRLALCMALGYGKFKWDEQ